MGITIKPITADDVAALEAQNVVREIVNGEWVERTGMAGKLHGLIAALYPFVTANNLGEVYQDNTTYVLEGTKSNIINMRIPDVSFVNRDRIDTEDPDFYYIAPDLAIEIVSPSETRKETEDKVADYLKYGTKQVWVLYPEKKEITVHLPDKSSHTYGENELLSGGDILPGFQLNVAEIFK